MINNNVNNLCRLLKQRRMMIPMTLSTVASISGISVPHLSRIESGKRTPSAQTLRKLAKPLGFEERELLCLAGYQPSQMPSMREKDSARSGGCFLT